jgi:hypothetical protein
VQNEESGRDAAHIWSVGGTWYVGTGFDAGLPVPTFDAALTLADLWVRLAGATAIVVRDSDDTVQVYSSEDPGEAWE